VVKEYLWLNTKTETLAANAVSLSLLIESTKLKPKDLYEINQFLPYKSSNRGLIREEKNCLELLVNNQRNSVIVMPFLLPLDPENEECHPQDRRSPIRAMLLLYHSDLLFQVLNCLQGLLLHSHQL
jgi:hypothetical protein